MRGLEIRAYRLQRDPKPLGHTEEFLTLRTYRGILNIQDIQRDSKHSGHRERF